MENNLTKRQWKHRAQFLEDRLDELLKRKSLEKNKVIKRQLQNRMEVIRELQKQALINYRKRK